jgi:hypothetical protein
MRLRLLSQLSRGVFPENRPCFFIVVLLRVTGRAGKRMRSPAIDGPGYRKYLERNLRKDIRKEKWGKPK